MSLFNKIQYNNIVLWLNRRFYGGIAFLKRDSFDLFFKRSFTFMTNIFCRATLYKVLVNFSYHDNFFFLFHFWEWWFSRRLFPRRKFLQVFAETIHCLSSFDAKKCFKKGREAKCSSCTRQAFLSSKQSTLQHCCHEFRSYKNQRTRGNRWSSWHKTS